MENTFIQKIVFLLVLFFSSVVLSHGTVIITNVEHDDGYIDVKIYDSKDSFLKEDEAIEAVRKKVKKGRVEVPLSKIHEGEIAIVVYKNASSDCTTTIFRTSVVRAPTSDISKVMPMV